MIQLKPPELCCYLQMYCSTSYVPHVRSQRICPFISMEYIYKYISPMFLCLCFTPHHSNPIALTSLLKLVSRSCIYYWRTSWQLPFIGGNSSLQRLENGGCTSQGSEEKVHKMWKLNHGCCIATHWLCCYPGYCLPHSWATVFSMQKLGAQDTSISLILLGLTVNAERNCMVSS